MIELKIELKQRMGHPSLGPHDKAEEDERETEREEEREDDRENEREDDREDDRAELGCIRLQEQ